MRRDGADGSSGGVVSIPPGVGSVASEARALTVASEGVEVRGVPVVVDHLVLLHLLPQRVASEGDHPFDFPPCHVGLLVEGDITRRLKAFYKILIA